MQMFVLDWFKKRSSTQRLWVISFAFWTFFGLTNFFLSYFRHPPSLPWWEDLFLQLLFWYSHVPALPVIYLLWKKFPVTAPHRIRHFIFHCFFSIVFVLAFSVMRVYFDSIHPLHVLGTNPSDPFMQRYLTILMSGITVMFFDYWALLGAVLALDYYQKFREREKEAAELQLRTLQLESSLAKAQVQALRMQLNPHFLFNTLHSISALVREENKALAIRMIAGLGDLLRQTLQVNSQEVTLRQELDFLEKYLEIEQLRFQDRLNVKMMIDPDTVQATVPCLILQPLVENALRHGISKSAKASLIEIKAIKENGNLILQVHDDGPGFPAQLKPSNGNNIGLANTQARLKSLYQNSYRFDLENAEDGGALATISIPFISGS